MIEHLYNKLISTKRLTDVAGTSKEIFSTYKTGIKCAIQQSADEKVFIDNELYRVYRMYCADTEDIQEHDQVNDGTYDYVVRAVNQMVVGENPHLEVILLRPE